MEKNNSHIPDYEAMASYLAGEMTEDEKLRFLQDLDKDTEGGILLNESKKLWNVMQPEDNFYEVNTQNAWEILSNRMREDNLIPTESNFNKSSRFRELLKWAAAILILVTVGTFAWLSLRPDQNNEMISVTNHEPTTLVHTLEDGSVVYLAPGTEIKYPLSISDNKRVLEMSGEIFIDVTPDINRPFVVQMPEAVIEVLGTSFNVNTRNETGLEVFVETGKVQVSLTGYSHEKIYVESGELLTRSGNKLEKNIPVQGYNTAWRKNQMQFKDEYLANILKVLNHNYNSSFVIQEKELEERRLTVTFYNNSITTITELICLSLNIDHEIKPDSSIVFKQKR
jgi:transmembrane sensor